MPEKKIMSFFTIVRPMFNPVNNTVSQGEDFITINNIDDLIYMLWSISDNINVEETSELSPIKDLLQSTCAIIATNQTQTANDSLLPLVKDLVYTKENKIIQ